MTVLAAILIALGAMVFTLSVRRQDLPEAEPVSPRTSLEAKKAAIYENLRDLQFEYRVGKLSDDDYQRTKQELQQELAGVLARIDAVEGAGATPVKAATPARNQCPHCGAKF
ncbi:MAG: hypothetical protein EHM65_02715, partial [Acidobacteriales bacterium]